MGPLVPAPGSQLVGKLAAGALRAVQDRRRLLDCGEVDAPAFVRVGPPLRAFLADEYDVQCNALEIADSKPL
jgi:hypothetical protein